MFVIGLGIKRLKFLIENILHHVMEELFKISKESRDFFLTKFYLDSNVNLKDIAFFRVELRSLFMKN
jgi:hypothetical protein